METAENLRFSLDSQRTGSIPVFGIGRRWKTTCVAHMTMPAPLDGVSHMNKTMCDSSHGETGVGVGNKPFGRVSQLGQRVRLLTEMISRVQIPSRP